MELSRPLDSTLLSSVPYCASVNGSEEEPLNIAFPGLSQGSPLSPSLYLFSNADLEVDAAARSNGWNGIRG